MSPEWNAKQDLDVQKEHCQTLHESRPEYHTTEEMFLRHSQNSLGA